MSKRPRPVTNITQSDYEGGPVRFLNNTGGSLTRGTLVYQPGLNAASGLLTMAKADADAAGKEAQWVVLKDVANNGIGVAGKFIRMTGVNTNAATSAGDPVYLSATAGAWTATAPTAANAIIQVVGFVDTKHASAGVVEVRIPASPKQIGTNEIEDGAVLAAKLGADVSSLTSVDNTTIETNAGALRIKDGGVSTAKLAANAVDATKLGQYAEDGLTAGPAVTLQFDVPDGATGNVDKVIAAKMVVQDVHVIVNGTNGANANTIQVDNGTGGNHITDAMSTNGKSDGDIVRAASITIANTTIAAGATVRIVRTRAGGANAAKVIIRGFLAA